VRGGPTLQRLPPDYEIRAPEPEEVGALPSIEAAAAQILPLEDLPTQMREDASSPAEFQKAAAEGRLLVAIYKPLRKPVGFALLLVVDDNGHLHELDVHPEHARQGLGASLVEAVVEWAQTNEFAWLTLTTFRHLRWNAPFYERHGFREFPNASLGPELVALREKESEAGFAYEKRLAMRLDVNATRFL
jgi:GNAT superfamily N-acetyltransferase